MARLRTLKPGFFTNDLLADVEPLGRLLFAGLWCHADREGRLADRPRRIKAEVLPYDECDVDALLAELTRLGFLVRYAADGEAYIQIVNFLKHQNPHIKEPPSTIPPPLDAGPAPAPAPADVDDASDEHRASTVQAPDDNSSSRAGLVFGLVNGLGSGLGDGAPSRAVRQPRVVREVYSAPFEVGWQDYPLKTGKHAAWLKYQERIRQGETPDRLNAAFLHYGEECRQIGREPKYTMHAATLLGPQKRYLDYVAGVPIQSTQASAPKGWAGIAALRDMEPEHDPR
jgi:hypothetical protein